MITEEFRAQIRRMQEEDYGEPTSRKQIQVRLPITVDDAIRDIPNRSAWVRKAIIDAAKRDGLIPDDYGIAPIKAHDQECD
jgi:hypothetical protein